MPYYEVINPHERHTTEADDFMAAAFAVLLLGNGAYGVRRDMAASSLAPLPADASLSEQATHALNMAEAAEVLRPIKNPSQAAMMRHFAQQFQVSFADAADLLDPMAIVRALENFCPGPPESLRRRNIVMAGFSRMLPEDQRQAFWQFNDARTLTPSELVRRAFYLAHQVRHEIMPGSPASVYYPPTRSASRAEEMARLLAGVHRGPQPTRRAERHRPRKTPPGA